MMDEVDTHIINAAFALLCEKNIDSIRLVDIAKEASVGRTTLYRHFDNKFDVVNSGFKIIYDHCFLVCKKHKRNHREAFFLLLKELYIRQKIVQHAFSSNCPGNTHDFTVAYLKNWVDSSLSMLSIGKNTSDLNKAAAVFAIGATDCILTWIDSPFSSIDDFALALETLYPRPHTATRIVSQMPLSLLGKSAI